MLAVFESLTDWRATANALADQHQAIVDTIEAGDSAGATALVERHIATFYASNGH
jgi:DNA-binding GntR family transcriptional regulator